MDDVVLDLLRSEFPFSFGLVAPNWVGRFKIESGIKKTLKNRNPRLVFTVVKRKGKEPTRFKNPLSLTPAGGQYILVKGVWILRLTGPITHRFKSLWRVGRHEHFVALLKHQSEPHV